MPGGAWRKALPVIAVVLLLTALYTAAGYGLGPSVVRHLLTERAQRMGLALELGAVRTDPFTLQVALRDVVLRSEKGELARVRRLVADLEWSSLWGDARVLEQASLVQPIVDLAALPAPSKAAGGPVPPVTINHLFVDDGTLRFGRGAHRIAIAALTADAAGLSTASGAPGVYRLAGRLAEGGEVSSEGRITLQPLSLQGRLALTDVRLAQARHFLPADLRLTVAEGTASANGRLRLDAQGWRFEGPASVSDARLEESGSGELLLAWKELATPQLALAPSPLRAELGEVTARAPSGRLVIDEEGRLNLARVLRRGNGGEAREGPRITLQRLRIEQGTLDFTDRSLENPFAVTARELHGAIDGLSTAPGDPARVQLEGRVAQFGTARIRGTVDLQAPKSLTDVSARLRNVPLAELTPYVVRFAGYRVESGRLAADLRYRVRDARLVGENRLTFEELQLGERVKRAGVADLPLELAVAVLADAQGRIRLDIPVSGDLNDPQFDFGGLVARAIGNVLGRIASAPFRALAAALGQDGADLDEVRFAPGSAELDPPAEEAVARVAKALAQRPALAVTVRGGYDAERDLRGLRFAHVRRRIAEAAGVDTRAPLDLADAKVLRAAERLFLQRAGNRAQLRALREKEPRYGRALMAAIAEALPADEEAAQILARARAEMVRAGLLAHGLEPARIRVAEPVVRPAQDTGVPTTLALGPARGRGREGGT